MEETPGNKNPEIGNDVPSSGNPKKLYYGYNGIVNVCGMIWSIMIHSRNAVQHWWNTVEQKGSFLEQRSLMLEHKNTFFPV